MFNDLLIWYVVVYRLCWVYLGWALDYELLRLFLLVTMLADDFSLELLHDVFGGTIIYTNFLGHFFDGFSVLLHLPIHVNFLLICKQDVAALLLWVVAVWCCLFRGVLPRLNAMSLSS